MKARTSRKIRWLLVSLLLGFLALAGLKLALEPQHPHRLAMNDAAVAAAHGLWQRIHAAPFASSGEPHGWGTPAGPGAWRPSGEPDTPPPHESARSGVITRHPAADPEVGASGGPDRRNDHPATPGARPLPQGGTGEFADNGYVPLDCELPAGCGVAGGGGGGVGRGGGRLPSLSTGGGPLAHDTQTPATNQQTSTGTVASAPELDPATLAAAVTLLLGSLAVLGGRRARARGAPGVQAVQSALEPVKKSRPARSGAGGFRRCPPLFSRFGWGEGRRRCPSLREGEVSSAAGTPGSQRNRVCLNPRGVRRTSPPEVEGIQVSLDF
jgi:hypothetical protein